MGRDTQPRQRLSLLSSFNPRARVGRDAFHTSPDESNEFQSTRPRGARRIALMGWTAGLAFQSTRPRGARPGANCSPCRPRGFNPRARVGRDTTHMRISLWPMFQSTRPRGARPLMAASRFCADSFNPRARVGRDWISKACRCAYTVSIHAPAWGATNSFDHCTQRPGFQSTRPRGARLCNSNDSALNFLFQSTRPRGARLYLVLQ